MESLLKLRERYLMAIEECPIGDFEQAAKIQQALLNTEVNIRKLLEQTTTPNPPEPGNSSASDSTSHCAPRPSRVPDAAASNSASDIERMRGNDLFKQASVIGLSPVISKLRFGKALVA
ncbi:unnamed protein product, partial [Choristocarpus tenellus]